MKDLLRILMVALAVVAFAGKGLCAETARQVDVHDPAMAQDGGTYYLYSTGPGITFYSSKDMIHWSARGRVFATEPAWARGVTARFNGHIWAPDISRNEGKYYLYYSVSGFGQNDSAIGVTVNKTLDPASPDYKWEDKGIVVRSVAGRDDWNAIDPNVIVDEHGAPWMTFGSFWSGIKLVRLNADWTGLANPQTWHSIARRDVAPSPNVTSPGADEIEGPFLFNKNGSYYLFVSTGLCCRGKNSTYRIMVGRSKDITGPYLDKDGRDMMKGGGTPLFAENRNWAGWGGQSVYSFDGNDYVVMHAYEAADNNFHRLKIAKIKWDAAGWPVIAAAALDTFHAYLTK